jgi:hypothetical protein
MADEQAKPVAEVDPDAPPTDTPPETPAAEAPASEALAPVIIIKKLKMAMAVPTVAPGKLRWPT